MATAPVLARTADVALRLRRPNRDQVTPVPAYLDALLAEGHLARLLWAAVARLDPTAFAAGLTVAEGGPGRAAADPQLLVGKCQNSVDASVVGLIFPTWSENTAYHACSSPRDRPFHRAGPHFPPGLSRIWRLCPAF